MFNLDFSVHALDSLHAKWYISSIYLL